ncbi:hypothetical protein [Candidatus Electronema sp. JM]|uniref:hypothetical protein n=1 Tax=Candidatus Electronema sp. JM TaxID=3401571 RepID=UPI003AA9D346
MAKQSPTVPFIAYPSGIHAAAFLPFQFSFRRDDPMPSGCAFAHNHMLVIPKISIPAGEQFCTAKTSAAADLIQERPAFGGADYRGLSARSSCPAA